MYGPQKTMWTSLKKRKLRRTNKNTSMKEELKVGLAYEAIAIVSIGQKEIVMRR